MTDNISRSLDPEYVDTLFEEMALMDVHLDPDPLLYTPTRLTNKISLVRGFLSRVQRIWTEMSQRQAYFKRQIRKRGLAYELEFTRLLAEDPEVLAGPSQGVREAIANRKLATQIEEMRKLEAHLGEIEILLKVSSSKRTDLKDIQTRIRDQIKLCEEELGLNGRKWGERGPGSLGASQDSKEFAEKSGSSSPANNRGVPELDELLEASEREHVPANQGLFDSDTTDTDIDAFFGDGESSEEGEGPKGDKDYSDLFT